MTTLLKKSRYSDFAALGVVVYQPRVSAQAIITTDDIRVNARCLVLMHLPEQPTELDPQEQKILEGMLGVLELQKHELMRVTIYGIEPDLGAIQAKIVEWAPEFILQLDMDLPVVAQQNCIQTFSPAYLRHNVQYKAQAYKSLLSLRAMLHGAPSKYNS